MWVEEEDDERESKCRILGSVVRDSLSMGSPATSDLSMTLTAKCSPVARELHRETTPNLPRPISSKTS